MTLRTVVRMFQATEAYVSTEVLSHLIDKMIKAPVKAEEMHIMKVLKTTLRQIGICEETSGKKRLAI